MDMSNKTTRFRIVYYLYESKELDLRTCNYIRILRAYLIHVTKKNAKANAFKGIVLQCAEIVFGVTSIFSAKNLNLAQLI